MTEDHRGFVFLSKVEVLKEIDGFWSEKKPKDDEWCYTNLYLIHEDFVPKNSSKDVMGILSHYHVDNHTLEVIKKEGFESLWQH
jgi:hypothetical protein